MILYYKYYLEVKNRIFLVLVCWISLLIISYYFKEPLLFAFINSNKYYHKLNDVPYFIFTDVTEIFYVYLQLVFFITNQLTVLMIFYHGLMFLALGLYKSEYIRLQLAFKVFIGAWLCSIILLKEFLIPFSWSFFLSFQNSNNNMQPLSFFFEARIVEYINYLTNLYYICLVNCQVLTLLTLLLANMSENVATIKIFRKLFYFIFVVFATITTPPDITSQIVISFTLIVIYEFLIFLKYLKV